jgi:hypothetical protein
MQIEGGKKSLPDLVEKGKAFDLTLEFGDLVLRTQLKGLVLCLTHSVCPSKASS